MSHYGLRHFAERDSAAVAIVDSRGSEWTRGNLQRVVDRATAAFVAEGLAPGDAIAILAPNCAEFLVAHLAGIAAGLYVVPVNWHLADAEIGYVLNDSGAKALVVHARLGAERLACLAAASGTTRLAVAIGAAPGFVQFDELIAAAPVRSVRRERGRVLAYTSATTGWPKGVRLPLGNAGATLAKTVEWHRSLGIELEHANVHLTASMLYHAAPLDGAVTALEMGHAVALMDGWDAESLLRVIEQQRVTTTFMVPTMFVRLLKLPESVRRGYDVSSLRFVVHSAAPCPTEVKRRMLEWWGPILWESYGASEVQGTIASPAEWLAHPGTVGRPIAGSRVMILGDDERELPAGAVGSVYLTPHTGDRFEYLGDSAKTAACRRGEFVSVGDRGYVDEDGFLFLVGRDSELIVSSGMNIYPAEIEQALLAHPAVSDCAVIGVPHELYGAVPAAHVQLAAGYWPSDEVTTTLLAHIRRHLSPMKLPRTIRYAERLPRDPNGKLLRRLLPMEGAPYGR